MAMFRMPRFIRRWLRSRMHPMAENKAWMMKHRIAIVYAIIAWNAAGLVFYQMLSGNKSWPITAGIRHPDEDIVRPAQQFAHSLGIPEAQVIKIQKFTNISEEETIYAPKEERPKTSPLFGK